MVKIAQIQLSPRRLQNRWCSCHLLVCAASCGSSGSDPERSCSHSFHHCGHLPLPVWSQTEGSSRKCLTNRETASVSFRNSITTRVEAPHGPTVIRYCFHIYRYNKMFQISKCVSGDLVVLCLDLAWGQFCTEWYWIRAGASLHQKTCSFRTNKDNSCSLQLLILSSSCRHMWWRSRLCRCRLQWHQGSECTPRHGSSCGRSRWRTSCNRRQKRAFPHFYITFASAAICCLLSCTCDIWDNSLWMS